MMESGRSHGPMIRAYRNAALSTSTLLTKLDIDVVSALVTPRNFELFLGDVRVLQSGIAKLHLKLEAAGVLTIAVLRVVMTRIRSGDLVVFEDRLYNIPTSGTFSIDARGSIDVVRDDLLRIEIQHTGLGSVALSVGSEHGTWVECEL
jgi:hypothetical protein